MKKTALITIIILVFLYCLSYGLFRQTHIENWEKDGQDYVIFPEDKIFIYFLYRPLSLVDGKITGMRFHIGQHR